MSGPQVAVMSVKEWLAESCAWVDAELDRLLPAEAESPARLHTAMRYALFGGGKRLRPALVRLLCRELGGTDERAARPAVAMELVHTYSLVHDDLPCMDDDDLRRGRPTCHVAFDEATAVLAGDALLTHAFDVLAAPAADPSAPGATAAGASVAVLAVASGSLGMVGGQVLDLELEEGAAQATSDGAGSGQAAARDTERERAQVAQVHLKKTAALFGASCELGALAADAPAGTCRDARAFGLALGLAFQAVDDLLDVTGDAATLGKTPGKDQALGRPTLVRALGFEGARQEADRLAQEARAAAKKLGFTGDSLGTGLIEYVLARRA